MTAPRRSPEDASLLDVLIDGFERNEILAGFHCGQLPCQMKKPRCASSCPCPTKRDDGRERRTTSRRVGLEGSRRGPVSRFCRPARES